MSAPDAHVAAFLNGRMHPKCRVVSWSAQPYDLAFVVRVRLEYLEAVQFLVDRRFDFSEVGPWMRLAAHDATATPNLFLWANREDEGWGCFRPTRRFTVGYGSLLPSGSQMGYRAWSLRGPSAYDAETGWWVVRSSFFGSDGPWFVEHVLSLMVDARDVCQGLDCNNGTEHLYLEELPRTLCPSQLFQPDTV